MNLNLMVEDEDDLKPRITVFGVGGAGGNAVNNMIEKQLDGVTFVVANTDAQALAQSQAVSKIQMGPKVTEGLGAGAKPAVGAKAAEETIEDIVDHLTGAHMCFITAGMGGGTGTGAAPIIAQAAREMGILTVGVVTKPFSFEGTKRMRQADQGVEALQKVVDTLIIIPNQNLFRLANEKTTFTEAFAMADDVLYQGVKGVTDLMVKPGLINLDFADVRSVMDEMGKAMMGTGEAGGDNRAIQAAEAAIANPLLDEISLNGAKGVLINVTGGYDMTLFELDEAANVIREKVDADANIIVGSTLDPDMEGTIRVSVVATGIDAEASVAEPPAPRSRVEAPATRRPVAEVEDDLPPRRIAAAPRMDAPSMAPPLMDRPAAEPRPAQASLLDDQIGYDEPLTEDLDDDLPQPAYQPRGARVDEAADFIAPQPAATRGQPSPAAMERLGRVAQAAGDPDASARREAAIRKAEAEQAQREQHRTGGLSRMFERMAGLAEGVVAQKPSASTLAERVSERVAARKAQIEPNLDDLASPERGEDDVQIPAFLRRQAN
ncbi:MAG: cell division protein FtsZ [Paracoccus sp. (in: a-proteobacteria)]|uniref:cell division protein FtsZ n=1 Tax=Paracoccus sp. TaxID=267 RepID=UPI0026DEE143|nr:cell division protein FtsZ [Paracoccus sp. (in: a-proteobacteria)]MDO5620155.1 cell division protein FtsZ [Paracoccus sp. (in: a-proteobacteria)]